jgi:hypothetical protein
MKLTDRAGQVLQLEIVGYQFPDAASKELARKQATALRLRTSNEPFRWDENWLIVKGRVDTSRGSWSFREPCLVTWEARSLASWLQRVASGETPGALGFTEPNLAFGLAPIQPVGDLRRVIVSFALEARPPWSSAETFEESPVAFDFVGAEIARAAADLTEQLATYPER